MVAPGKIRFGPYLFDLREQRLSGPAGEIPLNLKSAAVLAYLAQRPGQIVPKDELLHAVWADTAVTDDALVQRVLDVRKALGDNSKTPQYIRTHPKRGYEFVAAPDTPPVQPAPTRWWKPILAFALTVAAVAVFWFGRKPPATPVELKIAQLTFLPGMEDYPAFDATGRRILYGSDENGIANLWILEESSGDRRQVTQSKANLSEPDWSPDSDWIAFRSEEGKGGLFAKSLVTGETAPIAEFGHHPRWSPDGRLIAFHTAGAQSDLYIWKKEDRSLRRVIVSTPTLNSLSWPAWSQDGQFLYFIATAQFRSEPAQKRSPDWVYLGHQIWRVNAAGGEASVVTPGTGVLKDGGFDYDRTRSQLVFVGLDRGLWRSEIDRRTGAETAKPVRLTLTTQGHQHPRFSPGGEIAFSAIAAPEALWLVPFKSDGRLDEAAMTRLTTGAASVRAPVLSPDGRRIAYFLWQGERFELWLLDLETRSVRPIGPNDQLSRTSPSWIEDGRGLAYDIMDGRNRERRQSLFNQDFSKLIGEKSLDGAPNGRAPSNWDPTGRFRPYVESRDGQQNLWLERKDGPPLRLAGPGHYQSASWSAGGRRIYYQSDEDGWFNIWLLDFDPARGTPTGPPRQSSYFRGSPYLLSDSNLGFAMQPKGLVVPLRENRGDLWLIRSH
ncbi:MAG: PD40 domain-containing protein [Acidobacteria bacterium]|nr:PD40 domain-containing protein [Acidobacteriota bacterium]